MVGGDGKFWVLDGLEGLNGLSGEWREGRRNKKRGRKLEEVMLLCNCNL